MNPKLFWVKTFVFKLFFCQKIYWVTKNILGRKNLGYKNFWVQRIWVQNFWSDKILVQNNFASNQFWSKAILGVKQFWVQKIWVQNMLDPKILVQKRFVSSKILEKKNVPHKIRFKKFGTNWVSNSGDKTKVLSVQLGKTLSFVKLVVVWVWVGWRGEGGTLNCSLLTLKRPTHQILASCYA